MQADLFDQSPEQITLTNSWQNTKRRGHEDKEIVSASKSAIEQRKKINKRKLFSSREESPEVCLEKVDDARGTESKEVGSTRDESKEVGGSTRSNSSSKKSVVFNSEFEQLSMSASAHRRLARKLKETKTKRERIKTVTNMPLIINPLRFSTLPQHCHVPVLPPNLEPYFSPKRPKQNSNFDSVMVRQLNKQIIVQAKIISKLQQKLFLIQDIATGNKHQVQELAKDQDTSRNENTTSDNKFIHLHTH